jgi:hypothetical protein
VRTRKGCDHINFNPERRPMDDRRAMARLAATRHPLDPRLVCSITLTGRINRAPGVILEASSQGAGLYLRDRVEPGDTGALEPAGNAWVGGPLAVRVVHVAAEPTGGFRVGLDFDTPLSDAALGALLGEPPGG